MRNFVSIVASVVVIGSSVVSPAGAAEITLDAGPGLKWITAAAPDGNPSIPLVVGDELVIRQADPNGRHGFEFLDPALTVSKFPVCDPAPPAGTPFCLVSPYKVKFPGLGNPPRGEIMRLRVLQAVAADMEFQCSQHTDLMTGVVKKSP